jgi:hypothetical protein
MAGISRAEHERRLELYQYGIKECSECSEAHACRVSDLIAELERAAAKEPLTVRGSAGQKVIQPLISEIRFQRGLLARLLARLKFAGMEDD